MTKRQKDILDALSNGAREIETLRQANKMLEIQARGFEAFCGLVGMLAGRGGSQGYGIDAAWLIRKLHAELEQAWKTEVADAVPGD